MIKLNKDFVETVLKSPTPKAGLEVNGIDTEYKKIIEAELASANITNNSVDLNSLGPNLTDFNKVLFRLSNTYLTFNFLDLAENIQELIKNLINNFPICKLSQIYFATDGDEPWFPSYNKNLSHSGIECGDDASEEDFDFVNVPPSTPVSEESYVKVDAVSSTGEVEVSLANSSTHVIGALLHAPKPLSNLKITLPQSPTRDLGSSTELPLPQSQINDPSLTRAINNLAYAKRKLAEAVTAKDIENINKYTAAIARGKKQLTEIEISLGIVTTSTPESSDSRSSPSKLKASERQLENELHRSVEFVKPEVYRPSHSQRKLILQNAASLIGNQVSQSSMLNLNEVLKEREKLTLEELQRRANEKYLSMSCPDLLYTSTKLNNPAQKDLSQSVYIPELRI